MKKQIITLLIVSLLFSALNVSVVSAKTTANGTFVLVVHNNDLVLFPDAQPEIVNETTYVPIRFLAESLGIKVTWDKKTSYTILEKDNKTIIIKIKDKLLINDSGEEFYFECFIKDSRTMAPYRFITEYYGYEVSYIPKGHIARVKEVGKFSGMEKTTEAAIQINVTDEDIYNKYKEEIDKRYKEIEKQKKVENKKVIHLTFDDGPNKYTGKILDVLKKYNMKATFFLLEGNMKRNPELVKRIIAEGNTIGLHGVTHNISKLYSTKTSAVNEMNQENNTLNRIIGSKTLLIRVPYGSKPYMRESQMNSFVAAGYKLWDWNIDSGDTKKGYVSTSNILSTITYQVHRFKSPVILFHDKKCTLDALPQVLEYLTKNNYISKPVTNETAPMNWWKKN